MIDVFWLYLLIVLLVYGMGVLFLQFKLEQKREARLEARFDFEFQQMESKVESILEKYNKMISNKLSEEEQNGVGKV